MSQIRRMYLTNLMLQKFRSYHLVLVHQKFHLYRLHPEVLEVLVDPADPYFLVDPEVLVDPVVL
jgi:hypothetical protein